MNPHNPHDLPENTLENTSEEFDEIDDFEDQDDESSQLDSDEVDEQDDEISDEDDDAGEAALLRSIKVPQGRGLRSLPTILEEEEELPPSKTKIKKQMHGLQDLGEELVELSKDQLAKLDLPETLFLAIREMSRINKFGARRRQMQYIGKLMRDVDIEPINAKLDAWKGISQPHIGYMHQVERWREQLLTNDTALTELLEEYPNTDVQRLRTLIRNAQKEREAGKPGKNYREIFQLLREILPQPV